ncbi:MAG: hypothetical protein F4Z83_07550 [Gemmatimonadetes bacterium]|nr:hypothetical protein [Gemmatimonadota bacterium]
MPQNQPPRVSSPIADQVVSDSVVLNLAAHFTDPDGDALVFTATSADPAVALVQVAGATAVIYAVVSGSTTVTVRAIDPDGASVTHTFAVTVPNRAPLVAGPLPDGEALAGDQLVTRVSGHFTDPDGDSLTFAAASSNAGVATVTTSADEITVRAILPGVAAITVTATDPEGLSVAQDFTMTVPNRAPRLADTLPDLVIEVGGETTADLTGYFADPDGEELDFTVVSSKEEVAAVGVSGVEMTVGAIAKGTTTITVMATDPGGLLAVQEFAVMVPNRAPVVADAMADIEVEVGSEAVEDVSLHFTDPDDDTLVFTAASFSPAVATATVSGDELTVAAVAKGTATIEVTAADSEGLTVSLTFSVMVPNRAPLASQALPDVEVTVGEVVRVDPASHFTDPDGDELTFAVESSDASLVAASVAGDQVALRGVGKGEARVTVTATDTEGLTAEQSFRVRVPNRAPRVLDALPDIELAVDNELLLGLSAHFTDPDGDPLSFAAQSSDTGVATARVEGEGLAIGAVAAGTATVTVTASDSEGLEVTQSFQVLVPNRRPVVKVLIPGHRVQVGQVATVYLPDHFEDPDGDTLTFGARSALPAVASADVAGSDLSIRAISKGITTVTVYAADPGGLVNGISFDVLVPNRAPRVAARFGDRRLEAGEDVALTLSSRFEDPDGDALAFAVESSSPAIATATIAGDDLQVTAVAAGTTRVTVTASDPEGWSATQSFTVTVVETPTDHNPQAVGTIPDAYLGVGDQATISVSGYFTDPDGDELTFDASSSDASVAAASISGDALSVTAGVDGTATITVTATDPGGLFATQSFTVRVSDDPGNRAPRPNGTIPDAYLGVGDQATISVSGYFTDPDGDELTFDASSSDASVAAASISGDALSVTAGVDGTATITVTATDPGGLFATQSFTVRVSDDPGNRAPRPNGTIPDQTLIVGDELVFDVSGFFTDPDGDDLSFAAASSNTGVATASTSGVNAEVGAISPGTATITVTATDPGGLSATQSFGVTVDERIVDHGFDISLIYHDNVGATYRPTIDAAASRIMSMLADNEFWDAPFDTTYTCGGESFPLGTVDDVAIFVRTRSIDGRRGRLAEARLCLTRQDTYFPIVGVIRFDRADMAEMHADGWLEEVAMHEILHVMGIGTNFLAHKLAGGGSDRHFTGPRAIAAFNAAGGTDYTGNKVPTDQRWAHWRESVLDAELMTPSAEVGSLQPMSLITLQALADLGFNVDLSFAEDYELPSSGPQPDEDPGFVFDLSDDVIAGPIVVIDREGKIVRVIPGR